MDVFDFIPLDEMLDMHLLAVPSSVIEENSEIVPSHKKVIVGDITVLVFPGNVQRKAVKAFLEYLLNEAVSHNYTYFNRSASVPDVAHNIRYGVYGELIQDNSPYTDSNLLQVLEKLMESVVSDKERTQMAYCYALNPDWDNREANEKMHKMQKLLGGL